MKKLKIYLASGEFINNDWVPYLKEITRNELFTMCKITNKETFEFEEGAIHEINEGLAVIAHNKKQANLFLDQHFDQMEWVTEQVNWAMENLN